MALRGHARNLESELPSVGILTPLDRKVDQIVPDGETPERDKCVLLVIERHCPRLVLQLLARGGLPALDGNSLARFHGECQRHTIATVWDAHGVRARCGVPCDGQRGMPGRGQLPTCTPVGGAQKGIDCTALHLQRPCVADDMGHADHQRSCGPNGTMHYDTRTRLHSNRLRREEAWSTKGRQSLTDIDRRRPFGCIGVFASGSWRR